MQIVCKNVYSILLLTVIMKIFYLSDESYQQFQECLLQPTNMRNLLSKSITGMSERLADNLLEYNLSFLYGGIMLALLVCSKRETSNFL